METTIEELAELYLRAMIEYDTERAVDTRIAAAELGYDLMWMPSIIDQFGGEIRAESVEIKRIRTYDVPRYRETVYRVADMANSGARLLD